MGLRRASRVLHGGGQVAGLQLHGELAARLAQLVTTTHECDARVAEGVRRPAARGPTPTAAGALARAAREADRRLEVRNGVGQAGGRLRSPELGEHGRAIRVGRRLAQRPLEVAHRGGGHALGQCAPRGRAELADHGDVSLRPGLEQMRAHPLAGRARLHQHARCPLVGERASSNGSPP